MNNKRKVTFHELAYHVCMFALFFYTNWQRPNIPHYSGVYGREYKFLTVLNVKMSVLYYGFSIFVDLKELLVENGKKETRQSKSRNMRDYMFSSVLFPISSLVSMLYWGIYNVDSKLIAPPEIIEFIPTHGFYNHATHTAPIITSSIESLFTFHRVHKGFIRGAFGGIVFSLTYILWILWVAYYADFWVYPILKVLSPLGKTIFIVFAMMLGCLVYQMGVLLKRLRWRGVDGLHIKTE